MNFNYLLKLQKSGKLKQAEAGYRKLLKEDTQNSDIFTCLGLICIKTERELEAKNLFLSAVDLNSSDLTALNNLALISLKNKKYNDAKKYFLESQKINNNSKTLFFIGLIETELNNFDSAIKYYKKSIAAEKNPDSMCNLGNLYYIVGNIEKALKYTLMSLKENSKLDRSYNNLGLIFLAKGNFDLAKKNFIKAIKINFNNSRAHFNLSSITNYTNDNQHINDLLKLSNILNLEEEKSYIYFALGKVYEDIENYKESFKYYKKANKLRRKKIIYSFKEEDKLKKYIVKNFDKKNINEFKKFGHLSKSNIFVLGMPRSGTSLIEQILATHSYVYGAGEINFLQDTIQNYFMLNKKFIDLEEIKTENIYKAGKNYNDNVAKLLKNKKYIVNKLPVNFKWIGLIKMILPNSKIIHCKRNPADICLSIFKQNFYTLGNEYSFNFDEIVEYYNNYLKFMKHWENIFPQEIYCINYENLIHNQREETKKLLKFCSLPWENKCMEFTKTRRVVRTSSHSQVRKKIYPNSIEKWKNYKNFLNKYLKKINY